VKHGLNLLGSLIGFYGLISNDVGSVSSNYENSSFSWEIFRDCSSDYFLEQSFSIFLFLKHPSSLPSY